MDPKWLARIVDEAGEADLLEILAERLPGSDLNSLLLEVFNRRVKAVGPARLLQNYARNRLVRPGAIDPRVLHRMESIAFDLIPHGFEPIDLSPVCPLGTCAAVAPVNQNVILSGLRRTEVVSDSTNVLALECALRRRALIQGRSPKTAVKLCAAHDHLRTQRFTEDYFSPHFRIFALTSAGRDTGNSAFETEVLKEHVRFYLRLLAKLIIRPDGLEFVVGIADFRNAAVTRLENAVLAPLREEFPGIRFGIDRERTKGSGYYDGICFQIGARVDGVGYDLIVDGGFTDWVQKLLQDEKERLLASGIGLTYLWNILGKRMST
jgi:hypothetical protein